jgi:hypothetical protein
VMHPCLAASPDTNWGVQRVYSGAEFRVKVSGLLTTSTKGVLICIGPPRSDQRWALDLALSGEGNAGSGRPERRVPPRDRASGGLPPLTREFQVRDSSENALCARFLAIVECERSTDGPSVPDDGRTDAGGSDIPGFKILGIPSFLRLMRQPICESCETIWPGEPLRDAGTPSGTVGPDGVASVHNT